MKRYTISRIAKIVGGSVVRQSGYASAVRDVTTDSRRCTAGSLFVCLIGKKFDGHDFIPDVLSGGCRAICVSDASRLPAGNYNAILTDDTLKAYQRLAGSYRNECGFKVIGVTGSVGKTSTREFIAAALSDGLRVYRTSQNNNNEIGLPKTLLEAPADCDVCIVEMGMRAAGEIRELTLIAQPDVAVITNIGHAHIEFLGSRENILNAKAEILDGLKPGGLVILNTDDPLLRRLGEEISDSCRVAEVCTAEPSLDGAYLTVRALNIERGIGKTTFDIELSSWESSPVHLKDISIPVPGRHNVLNALFGIASAVECGINLSGMVRGLQSYVSVGNRQRVIECGKITLIDDSYNAGPESMFAAISMLRDSAAGRRKIAILGGMLELGEYSALSHVKVGKACADSGVDIVFCAAEEARWYKEGILSSSESPKTSILSFSSADEMTDAIVKTLEDHDIVLVKGSRGFKMEQITEAILSCKSGETVE
ncbi:MAG: UDP-N-acetylmuramoyl-tripeptide--D-alanyl-D-alanine ligase [Saccharofermentanales bacterium]